MLLIAPEIEQKIIPGLVNCMLSAIIIIGKRPLHATNASISIAERLLLGFHFEDSRALQVIKSPAKGV